MNDIYELGQRGVARKGVATPVPPLRHEEIERGFSTVAAFALQHGATLCMPRIGCGLAGGTWDKIDVLLRKSVPERGVAVTVCDLQV